MNTPLRLLLTLIVVCVCSCGPIPRASDNFDARIGVTQIVTHPGIDAVRNGFVDEMAKHGKFDYEFTNANGDFSVAQAIAKKIANSQFDLIFSISTPSTQALLQAVDDAHPPIVFGAITDPVAAGIVQSLKRPGGKVTGTTDVWPVGEQLELLQEIIPDVSRVGVIHNPAETNSVASVDLVSKAAARRDLELVLIPVSNSGEVPAATRSLIGRVDAIYIPADNTVISALASIVSICERNGLPLMPGDTSNVEIGGFGTIGHDYYSIGVESARIALEILGGTDPGDIPVRTSSVHQYYFNLQSAKAMDVVIPEALLAKAAKIYDGAQPVR